MSEWGKLQRRFKMDVDGKDNGRDMDYSKSVVKPLVQPKQSMILEGPSGTGKTYQFRTLVEAGMRGLYVSTEMKVRTIADLNPDIWYIERPDFPLSAADKNPGIQDLMRLIDFLRTPDHGYDFVYVDSGMRYASDLLKYLRREKRLTAQELWSSFAEKLETALELLPTLTDPKHPAPVHVVVTWGVETDTDWQGVRSIQPIIDGKRVKPKINYWFDHVLYLEMLDDVVTGESKYVMHTRGKQGFAAKVSSGMVKFPAVIESPNLATIIKAIEAGNGAGLIEGGK